MAERHKLDDETERKFADIMQVVRAAVREAQAESRRLGVANVYYIDGQVVYELPNGEYTSTPPSSTVPGENNAAMNRNCRSDEGPVEG